MRGDLVLVQFPFTDLSAQKLRPALIVGRVTGDDVIVAFISSRISSSDPRAEHVLDPIDTEFRATLCQRSVARPVEQDSDTPPRSGAAPPRANRPGDAASRHLRP